MDGDGEPKFQNCLLCGAPLIYSETASSMTCVLCKNVFNANVQCKDDHYVCDDCHAKDAFGIIRAICETTDLKDPIQIMEYAFKFPQIKMHGPEHHFLVPAAIVTALKNNGHDVSPKYLAEIEARAKQVPGGACGFWGACGAGIGVGIAFSVFFKATPKKRKERGDAIEATSIVLGKIADRTEQCCKRESRLAIEAACDILKERYDIAIPCSKGQQCSFGEENVRCNKDACEFYGCKS